MGQIGYLQQMRARRTRRRRRAAALAPLHPALRWSAGDGLAHRRAPRGVTVCGADLDRLAEPGTPACPRCYPPLDPR